jgi:type I restriction enzyme S subunit
MTAWGKTTLGSVAALVSSKVPASSITLENYVSTENMLPDFGGVVDSPSLPSLEKFNSYCQSDTLFSNIRTYFKKVWFANKNGGASADVLVFRTQDPVKLDPRFLNYVLSSQKFIDFSDLTAKGAKLRKIHP